MIAFSVPNQIIHLFIVVYNFINSKSIVKKLYNYVKWSLLK